MSPLDPGALRERLQSEIGPCLASDLQAHVKRGAVVVVDRELPLLEVALAVALDNTAEVQGWISQGRLKTPSIEQIALLEKAPELPFLSVIVRPYVLVQELGREED